MNGFFIAGYVLFGVMSIIGIIYLYALFNYSKYTLFTKSKISWPAIAIYAIVLIILLIAGILFCASLKNTIPGDNTNLHAGLCFGFMGIDVLNIIAYVLIINLHNKKKIPYSDIPKTDFKPALAQIKAKIGDIEVLKAKIQKHHKKYYQSLISTYSELLKQLHQNNFSKSKIYADIVMFNDAYAHKWCGFTNNLQLLLTYEILTII